MRQMVRILLLAVVTTVFVACGTTIRQHNIPCADRNPSDVVRSLTSILIQSGFRITHSDTLIGLIQAQTDEQRNIWSGGVEQRVWQISLKRMPNSQREAHAGTAAPPSGQSVAETVQIVATAKVLSKTQNAFGATLATAEIYYGDDTHEDWEWYWDVRNAMQSLCGTTAVITNKKMH